MKKRIRTVLAALSLVTVAGGAYAYAGPASDPACHEQCALEYQECQTRWVVEWYCELQYDICSSNCNNP